MRDRLATPFFPLSIRGLESSARELQTPGVSARHLEGQIIGNGRFLLIEKTGHTATSARYLAKDMHGGIDVEIEVHRDERKGFRVGRHDTSEHKALPDLCRAAQNLELPAASGAPPQRSLLARAWRALRPRRR
jgi:hypothetical protein